MVYYTRSIRNNKRFEKEWFGGFLRGTRSVPYECLLKFLLENFGKFNKLNLAANRLHNKNAGKL